MVVQGIIVQITVVAEFTQRMPLVRFVICITNSAVSCQIGTTIRFQLMAEFLQMRNTKVTEIFFMFPLHVVTKTIKVPVWWAIWAELATMLQESFHPQLDLFTLVKNMLPLISDKGTLPGSKFSIGGIIFGYKYLYQISPANRTIGFLSQHTHSNTTLVAHWMVTCSNGEILNVLTANNANNHRIFSSKFRIHIS